MKKRTIAYIFFCIFLCVPVFVIAIDPTTSGRIIDAFKKQEYAMIFENLPFDESHSREIYEQEYRLAGIEGLKKRLEAVTRAYTEKKQATSEKRLSLEENISIIEYHISQASLDIRKTETSIDEKNTRINEYQELSAHLALRIKNNRSIILSYMTHVYADTNLIFNEHNSMDVFQSLILSDADTDDTARDIVYTSLISILGQKFIEDYRSLIREYNRIQVKIHNERDLLEMDKTILERQRKNLIAQRDYKDRLLEVTKGQESLYEKYISDQMKAQAELETAWKDAANEYTLSLEKLLQANGCNADKKTGEDAEKCNHILSFYQNERALKKLKIATGSVNVFDWPIQTKNGISAYFRDPSYFRAVGSQHDAIDIPATHGTDIYAPMDGYVQYILPPVSGGYSYMALKHPDGYVSVYGHLSEILVSRFQFVNKGQLIARSGGAPGTPGAGPMTTGAHLHLEIWKDREPIDPLRVLDISRLEYADLPPRYQDKFISDIIARVGTGTDLSEYDRKFILKGENETDRQKYLLSTYATPDFRNYDMWIDAALDARLDASFLMCVGLAETTLGNYLKTPYNIGNVGNTDSGDTVAFSSPREGIEWMASTFNNRYLSHYRYVSQLSRWGNVDGTIYASSNANWHNNIIRCISSLKGRFVEDKYPFRITSKDQNSSEK